MYYIKVRKTTLFRDFWDYVIFSDKKRHVAISKLSWIGKGSAVRAAKKVASDLGIKYHD